MPTLFNAVITLKTMVGPGHTVYAPTSSVGDIRAIVTFAESRLFTPPRVAGLLPLPTYGSATTEDDGVGR